MALDALYAASRRGVDWLKHSPDAVQARIGTMTAMSFVSKVVTGAAIGVAAAAAWSRFVVDREVSLVDPVPADEVRSLLGPLGQVTLYAAGVDLDPEPVLLVHSVNAAASAYEMSPLFAHYRDERPTYAIDLPGYGHSARAQVEHTAESMAAAVACALDEVGPAHVVALSLGSEFAARAAIDHPDRVLSLTMISPTGLSSRRSTAEAQWLESFFSVPIVGRASFDLLASRASIRWFVAKSFAGEPDEGLVEYAYLTAHQPGGEYAPAAFLSGRLFTSDALDQLYAEVPCPMQVLYDTDPNTDFARLPELVSHARDASAVRIPGTRGLPHFEQLDAVTAALDAFWAS
jgi:pimeloyl-ACP methyl ester carboxylesterase